MWSFRSLIILVLLQTLQCIDGFRIPRRQTPSLYERVGLDQAAQDNTLAKVYGVAMKRANSAGAIVSRAHIHLTLTPTPTNPVLTGPAHTNRLPRMDLRHRDPIRQQRQKRLDRRFLPRHTLAPLPASNDSKPTSKDHRRQTTLRRRDMDRTTGIQQGKNRYPRPRLHDAR